MSRTIDILSTRSLEDSLIDLAKQSNIQLHTIPFIKTEPVETVQVQQEVEQTLLLQTTVVFTSMNAVEAVYALLDDMEVQWNIYCIGYATKELVEKYFGESSIAGTAASATELAQLIIEENISDDIIFFCGDMHRKELPDTLAQAGMEVMPIVVYETVPIPRKVIRPYDGIIFFSPSAVDSFFSINTIAAHTCIFAIGKTTAATIRKYCQNELILAQEPSKKQLVLQAIHRFKV